MDRFRLTAAEQVVFDTCATAISGLNEASQYIVLRNLAHAMEREVVKPGAVRAAAAVAGSTAKALAESKSEEEASSKKKSKKKSAKHFSYPPRFLESGGQALLDAQCAAKGALADPPTEPQKAALKAASESLRDSFRRFNEADEKTEDA
jgi:hypothetical protein